MTAPNPLKNKVSNVENWSIDKLIANKIAPSIFPASNGYDVS